MNIGRRLAAPLVAIVAGTLVSGALVSGCAYVTAQPVRPGERISGIRIYDVKPLLVVSGENVTIQMVPNYNRAYALRFGGALVAAGAPVDHGTADDLYRQAMARAGTLAMRPLVALCRLDLGRHLPRLSRMAEARNELAQAAHEFRSLRMTLWLRQAEAVVATLR